MSTPEPAALIELGDRYAALGLEAAAESAFERARQASGESDSRAARRLAELAIAGGDADRARALAEEVARAEKGPSARLLVGRAQIEANALDAARLSFSAALEAAGSSRELRARAHLGLARVAGIRGDSGGAGAHAMAATDELVALAAERTEMDELLPLAEDAIKRAIAAGRARDVDEVVSGADLHVLRAVALAARQARGEAEIRDGDIEAELGRALAARPGSSAIRLYLAERMLRRRGREASARTQAIAELEALAGGLAAGATPGAPDGALLARVHLMLAAAYEEDPASADRAEAAYRAALELRPANAGASGRLALMALARGDLDLALAEVERTLRIDGDGRVAWRNAARAVSATHGADADDAVAAVLDAACPGRDPSSARAAARLLAAGSEIEREVVLAGVHARGHRLKNLLGIIGARVRSARKKTEGESARSLRDLEDEVTTLYDEWAAYLRSMQSPTSAVIELVPVAPLVDEVVEAARARGRVAIDTRIDDGLPDLRGDRMLLREALLNVINNAAEACEASGGRVEVSARQVRSGATPVVEIEVVDDGPGISRADLARVFSPGFTTKESGSGVGLVIAERVVASHHGRILVDSEVEQGTRVSLMLPSDLGGFAGLASFPLARGGGE